MFPIEVKFRGLAPTINRMKAFEETVSKTVQNVVRTKGFNLWQDIRRNVDREFQETVSYVFESILGLPGTKPEFADPSLVGTFSRRAPELAEPWLRQVQKYRKGAHVLRDRLKHEFQETAKGIYVERIGYHRSVGRRGTRTRYVIWVLYGTQKMQARPFLQLALHENAEDFMDSLFRTLQGVIGQTGIR